MDILERGRKVLYKNDYSKTSEWNEGWCLLITGGMMSEPIMVIEKPDGCIIKRDVVLVKFVDRKDNIEEK